MSLLDDLSQFEVTISTPEGMTAPTMEQVARILADLAARDAQFLATPTPSEEAEGILQMLQQRLEDLNQERVLLPEICLRVTFLDWEEYYDEIYTTGSSWFRLQLRRKQPARESQWWASTQGTAGIKLGRRQRGLLRGLLHNVARMNYGWTQQGRYSVEVSCPEYTMDFSGSGSRDRVKKGVKPMARFLGGEEIKPPPPPQRYRCPRGHEVEIPSGYSPQDPAVKYGVMPRLPVLLIGDEGRWRCEVCLNKARQAWLKSVAPIMEEVSDATN